jgi:hypothetical protein
MLGLLDVIGARQCLSAAIASGLARDAVGLRPRDE